MALNMERLLGLMGARRILLAITDIQPSMEARRVAPASSLGDAYNRLIRPALSSEHLDGMRLVYASNQEYRDIVQAVDQQYQARQARTPAAFGPSSARRFRVIYPRYHVAQGDHVVFRAGHFTATSEFVLDPGARWELGFVDCLDPLTVTRVVELPGGVGV